MDTRAATFMSYHNIHEARNLPDDIPENSPPNTHKIVPGRDTCFCGNVTNSQPWLLKDSFRIPDSYILSVVLYRQMAIESYQFELESQTREQILAHEFCNFYTKPLIRILIAFMDRQCQINYHHPSVFTVLHRDSTSIPLHLLLNSQTNIPEAIFYTSQSSLFKLTGQQFATA